MLIVTRAVDEEIVIANEIRILVVKIQKARVRLGISAPNSVSVKRAELRQPAEEPSAEGQPCEGPSTGSGPLP